MEGRTKHGRWRRLGRWVGRAALALAALLVLVWLTRDAWLHPWLLGRVERLAADRLGAELEVGALESRWFDGALLRDVSWRSSEPPLLELRAPLVRARWSLLGLATGDPLWLEELEARIDTLALATVPSTGEPAERRDTGGGVALPAHLPRARVQLGRMSYRLAPSQVLEVADAALAVEPGQGPERIELTAGGVTWLDGGRELTRPLELAGRYAAGRIELERASLGDLASISRGAVDLTELADFAVGWDADGRALGADLTSSGRVAGGATSASFSVRDFELVRLEDLLGPVFPAELDRRHLPRISAKGELAPRQPVPGEPDGAGQLLALEWVEARNADVVVRGVDLAAPLLSDWRELVRAARGRILLEDLDRPAGVEPAGALPPLDLDLTAELADGRAQLGGHVATPGGDLRIERGEVRLGPAERLLKDAVADLDVEAAFDDLAPLGRTLGLDWAGELRGRVEVDGPLLAPTGRLEGEASGVVIEGFELGRMVLTVVAAGGRVDVLDCDVTGAGWSASLAGGYVLEDRSLEDLEVELSGGGLALGPVAPRRFDVSLAASGPVDAPQGAFSLAVDALGLDGFEELDLRASGTFDGRAVVLESLLADDAELALSARARAAQEPDGAVRGALEQLELTAPDGSWTLAEPAPVAWLPAPQGSAGTPGLELGPVLLNSRVGERAGSARLAFDGRRIEADFEAFEPAPLRARLVPPAWGTGWGIGGLDGNLRIELPATPSGATAVARPTASFDLSLSGLVVAHRGAALPPQDLRLSGELTDAAVLDASLALQRPAGRLELEVKAPFDLAAADHPLQPGPVSVRLSSGPVTVDELASLLALPPDLAGTLSVEGRLEGEWSALRGELDVRGTELSSSEVLEALAGPVELQLTVRLDDRIEVERGLLSGPPGQLLSFGGSLDAAPDVAAWIRDPAGLLEAGLDLRGDFALPLEGWAGRVESVRRLSGRVEGTLSLQGTLSRPDPRGRVSLRQCELRLASAVPSIRDLNAELDLRPDSLEIRSMELEFGGAPCTVTGGVSLPGAGPLGLDLELAGRNLLIARSSTALLRANAGVHVQGPLDGLAVSGEVVITEGRFAQEIDILSKLVPGGEGGGGGGAIPTGTAGELRLSFARSGPLATASFDLRVRSESQIRIKGNLYDIWLRPQLEMHGTGEVPMFEGEVYVDSSSLSLPSGRLRIESGVVRFSRRDPFRPRIALSAEMETKGYDIEARIDGPIGAPEVLLTSNPPLANDQLLLLFLTGQTPKGSSPGLGAAQTVGVYLAQDVLVRWLGGGTTEADSLLDHLVFEYGAEITHSGAPTMVGRYYLDSRRRRTGRTTYLLAEKDIWDRTNFGYGIRFRFE